MELGLQGKVAIVTGSGQWIGRAIALRLAEEGADIVVNDIVIELANKAADEIKGLGRKALAIKADATKMPEAEQMVKSTLAEFGKIDILVNNVGGPAAKGSLFHESKEEVWDSVLSRNLKSTRNCSRAVIGHMMERGSGRIINLASTAGITGGAGSADYSAAKGGIISFTMALAQDVASYGIRVNCVSPGPIGAANDGPERIEQIRQMTALGRRGKPEEIAAMVAFLASYHADYITCQNFTVSGPPAAPIFIP